MRALAPRERHYHCPVVGDAGELARRAVERWNAHDLEPVYADWEPEIVVRPDPYFPDSGVLHGKDAARRFWEDQRDALGYGHLEILETHDLGDRCLLRVRQHVEAPASGVRGAYDWSFVTTARAGKVVRIEFFIDRDHGLAAVGLTRGDS